MMNRLNDLDLLRKPIVLMCKDEPVLSLSEQSSEVYNKALVPLNLEIPFETKWSADSIADKEISFNHYFMVLSALKENWITWLSWRTLSIDRYYYKKIVNALHIQQDHTPQYKAKAALAYRGMSLDDSYWVCFPDEEEQPKWEDVSLRHNSLGRVLSVIALTGSSMSLSMKNIRDELTAEITTHGSYPKGWFRHNGGIYMYKADALGGEVTAEICAAKVIDCFNIYGQVRYEEAEMEGLRCSRCKLMTTDDIGIIHAGAVDSWARRNGSEVVSFAKSKWLKEFSQMMVIDYLLANSDRHLRNWGFFQSMITGEILRPYDLYDHNCCFSDDALKDEEHYSLVEDGLSMEEAALKYIGPSELRFVKEPAPDMFPSEEIYGIFVKRCKQLGLEF